MATLDELIAEAEQAERVQASAAEAAQRAEQQQKQREFETRFRVSLSDRMFHALVDLHLEFGSLRGGPCAVFVLEATPNGEERRLLLWGTQRGDGVTWRVSRPDGYNASLWRGHQEIVDDHSTTTWEKLEVKLLAWLRCWRAYLVFECEQYAAQVQREREREELDRLRAEQRKADEEAEQQRRQALYDLRVRVLNEHEECQAELKQRQAEARAGLWRWPAERAVSVFNWRWQTGATVDEDGDLCVEHDSGWSTQSALDDGWIDLQPIVYQRARRLRLSPEGNHPVAEEVVLTPATLPRGFLEVVQLDVPGLRYDPWFDLDGEQVCITVGPDEEMPLRRDPEGRVRVEIGRQALAWVRQLVESAGPAQPARSWLHDLVDRGDIFEIPADSEGDEDGGESDDRP